MTAKESKAVAWQWRIKLPMSGWTEWCNGGHGDPPPAHSTEYHEREHRALIAESALHAAEAELGELRRRVLELAGDLESDAIYLGNSHEAREFTADAAQRLRDILASDGGADGDNEGEGK